MRNSFIIVGLVVGFILMLGCTGAGGTVEEQSDRAATLNNPSLCNQMDDRGQSIECMARVADLKNDPKICVESNASDVDCVARYGQRKNDIKACDVFSDPLKRYSCVAKMTGDSTGRSIDIIIGDFNTRGKVTACLNQCVVDMQACRQNCEATQISKNKECDKLDKNYSDCYVNAIDEKNACQTRCTDVSIGPCDSKCREMG